MGMDKYVGGGYVQDKRWTKEEQDEDGNLERVSFLKKLKLASFAPLENLEGRVKCPSCNRVCKYYCYLCFKAVGGYDAELPKLDLPVKVTLLSHPKEKKSKSSVVPVKILAQEHVDFVSSADAPDLLLGSDLEVDQVAILFPGESATEVTDMTPEELHRIKRVVIIDSTWG